MRDIEFRVGDILISTNVKLRNGSKGFYKENGYIMRKVNYHPKANKRGYVAEHRLVYESYLGRFLDTNEVIHHIDGNRNNNHLKNLKLEVYNSEHIKNNHKQFRNKNGQFVCSEPIFNEIQFRLFDKDRKITLTYTLNKLISTTFRRSKFEFRGRFTGLKDKNGTKIFEGDVVINEKHSYDVGCEYFIVKYTDKEVASCGCCYNEFCGIGFIGEEITGKKYRGEKIRCHLDKNCEVIGNIYDNPELLEDK